MNIYRKIIQIIDIGFQTFILFLLSFIWCRYYINSLTLSFFASLCLLAIILFIMIKRKNKQKAKYNITKEDNKKANILNNYILFNEKNAVLHYISTLFDAQMQNNYILKDKDLYYINFSNKPFNKDNLIELLQDINFNNFTSIKIISNSFSKDIYHFTKSLENLKIDLIDLIQLVKTYPQIDYENLKPQILIKENAKLNLKDFLYLFIEHKNAKGYFFSAIIILIMSLVVPQKIYYYIFSSILLVLAFFCSFFRNVQQ